MEALVSEQQKEQRLRLRNKNKMTEKNYNPEQRERKAMRQMGKTTEIKKISVLKTSEKNQEVPGEKKKIEIAEAPVKEENKKQEEKIEGKKGENIETVVEKKETKKQEKPKIKRDNAIIRARDLPLSTKKSSAFCKFIKNKEIERAIADLEDVLKHRKAVPSKGEIPHKRGMASGIYSDKTAEYFLKLIKSLRANAVVNNLENPVISEAFANIASRPFSKFGRVRKKRSHITIKAVEKLNKKGEKK